MIFLYITLLFTLTVFGFHRLSLIVFYLRNKKRGPVAKAKFENLPNVTVQLPVYNEKHVVERLIRSVGHLNYPSEKLHIQILDDSTDQQALEISDFMTRELRENGLDVELIHRKIRTNYKAGALKNGLKTAKGEFVAIFDADFIPNSDFLLKTLDYFTDSKIGMVQVRWGYLNRKDSLLTRGQATLLDGHFQIEHTVRNRSNHFFNFNGTAGVWRKETIIQAGNWQGDTLTEDLDLSYRAQLNGSKFVYLVDYDVPSELPSDIYAFKSQQHRWTLGSVQVCLKLAKNILFSQNRFSTKLEAFAHLGANFCYPLLLLAGLLLVPLSSSIKLESGLSNSVASVFFLCGILSVLIFYSIAVKQSVATNYLKALLNAFLGLFTGTSLCLSNSIAVFEGFFKKEREFKRTPKSGLGVKTQKFHLKNQWRPWLVFLEAMLFVYFSYGLFICIQKQNYAFVSFLTLFVISFAFITIENLRCLNSNQAKLKSVLSKT